MKNPMINAQELQRNIYIQGFSGKKPIVTIHPERLEALAKRKMSAEAFAYIAGGAGAETTLRSNRNGFDQWQIVPRMLRNVEKFDLSVQLFDHQLSSPLLLAPVGVLDLAHPKGEIAVAQAAASRNVPMIFSNQASTPMEVCSAHMGDTPRWFQLYWSKSRDLVASFIQRATACGCSAIVLTLDTTMLGWRPRDLELAYLPFLQGRGIAQYTSDPVFQHLLELPDDPAQQAPKPPVNLTTLRNVMRTIRNYPGSFTDNLRSGKPLKAVRQFTQMYTNPALQWEDLSFLRNLTSLPILLKGILHPEDAKKALEHGINGLIVSNHGGRQVDGAIAAIEALPGIVEAVQGQIPVLLDSGIRSGSDMFKALALGAKAVCIGRPYVYGLAVGGSNGVQAVIDQLLADFELNMRIAGCSSVTALHPQYLKQTK
jgi:lactate 2-monooxygenase